MVHSFNSGFLSPLFLEEDYPRFLRERVGGMDPKILEDQKEVKEDFGHGEIENTREKLFLWAFMIALFALMFGLFFL